MLAGGEAVWRNRSRRSALIRSALAQPPLRATPVYYQYHGERKMPVRLENNPCPVHILLLASAILLAALGCQQPQPPYSPEAALDTFQLPAGFRIELVAAEPDVHRPGGDGVRRAGPLVRRRDARLPAPRRAPGTRQAAGGPRWRRTLRARHGLRRRPLASQRSDGLEGRPSSLPPRPTFSTWATPTAMDAPT